MFKMVSIRLSLRQIVAGLCASLVSLNMVPLNAIAATAHRSPAKSVKHVPAPPAKMNVKKGSKQVRIVDTTPRFSAEPTDLEIRNARIFPEPLVPLAKPQIPGENKALIVAIQIWQKQADRENINVLNSFLQKYPKSRWNASLLTNLGLWRYDTGYLTDALNDWRTAWSQAKTQQGREQKATADRAVSELMILNSKLGRVDELKQLLAETQHRGFLGSNEERVRVAQENLYVMQHRPEIAFKCGPYAINRLLPHQLGSEQLDPLIKDYPSTNKGTSLLELKALSAKLGLHLQVAKRSTRAPMVVPSILHWKVGHYAAVLSRNGDKYILNDRTFGEESHFSLSPAALDHESDGYFLIQAGELPTGWQSVSEAEAATVWGKGYASGRNENQKGSGAPRTGGPPNGCGGLAKSSMLSMTVTPNIADTPLSYSPPIGPAMNFSINYNYLETNQPSTFTFTSLSPDWTINWLSYLTVDSSNNVTVRIRGGGSEVFNYSLPDNLSNPYSPDMLSQAVIVKTGASTYQRQLPDGSIEVFNQPDGTGRLFMTQVIDPRGNAATIQFDSNMRIATVTDALGQVSTFSYVSNTVGNSGFYLLAQITDPFSRSCTFSYDAGNSYLASDTDVVGLVSKFTTDSSSSFITALTTPYGTTSFYTYAASSSPYNARGLQITYPDGTYSVAENWMADNKHTYYWDREATALYPNDPANHIYTHCRSTLWLLQTNGLESAVQSQFQGPLTGLVSYFYNGSGATDWGTATGINVPIKTQQVIAFNPPESETITGTVASGQTITQVIVDSGLSGGSLNLTYTTTASDTLSTVAAAVAQLINSNSALQSLNITASNVPGSATLDIASRSVNRTTYNAGGSGTVGVSLLENYMHQYVGTVGGTVTVGNTVYITVSDAGLTGGTQTVSYTTVSGDTTTTIAAGLAAAINANANLRQARISANSSGAKVGLWSNSVNSTSYAGSVSSGAAETFAVAAVGNVWAFGSVTGTPHAGDTVSSILYDAGLTGGYKYATYTIRSGDTLGSISAGLAGAINADSDLQRIGMSAFAGPDTDYWPNGLYVLSRSLNSTSYGATRTGTGTATLGYNTRPDFYTETNQWTSNSIGKITSSLDNDKRTFTYAYAANGIDLLEARETTGGDNALLGKWEYNNSQHVPNVYIDGSGQQTQYTYNSFGELATVVDANSNTTTFNYNSNGYLTSIDGPLLGSDDVTTFTYDSYGRLYTVTDSEGYTLTYSYDSANRVTQIAYPDGSTEQFVYDRLDQVLAKDRIGRWTTRAYDNLDQLIAETDPLGRKTQYQWCACGSMASLTDPAGHTTSWAHDLEGRTIQKTYPDGTAVNYVWQNSVSRLSQKIDAMGQVSNYTYEADGRLGEIAFAGAVNTTLPMDFHWDGPFPRRMGAGYEVWNYNPYITDPFATPTTGGGRLASIQNLVIPNSTITFVYDSLGRTTNRSINGSANSITWSYDAVSRVTSEANTLGTFNYSYLDNTSGSSKGTWRLSSIAYPNGQTTNFSWINPSTSQWLASITNLSPSSTTISAFTYGYDNAGEITSWGQTQSGSGPQYNFGYDAAGQLTTAQAGWNYGSYPSGGSGPLAIQNYYSYDSAGNRTSFQKTAQTAGQIGGVITVSDTVTVTVIDPALSGGQKAITYTATTGDTTTSVAAGLANGINADSSLQAAGVNATNTANILVIKSASPNITTYSGSTSTGATETIALGVATNIPESMLLGGSATAGDTPSVVFHDAGLSGGQKTITVTVASGDTLSAVATKFANAINADTSLQAIGVSATAASAVTTINSRSSNPTSYTVGTFSGTETITLAPQINGTQTIVVGGTKTTGDVVTLTVFDVGLSGGSKSDSYTVVSGDTLSSIASNLAGVVNGDGTLAGLGISATANSTTVKLQSNSPNLTTYRPTVSASATETLTVGNTTEVTQYAYNNVNELVAYAGGGQVRYQGTTNKPAVSATISSSALTMLSPSATTTYTSSVSGSATETVTFGTNLNGNITASLGGTVTTGDAVTVTVHNASLPGGQESVSYTAGSGDSLISIASGLANAFNADSALHAFGATAANSNGASLAMSESFSGNAQLANGSNLTVATVVDGSSNAAGALAQAKTAGPSAKTLTYDLNGNMTSDGTNTYAWDAADRLIQITYPGSGNYSQFSYDGWGRNSKIVEVTGGTTFSTKQFVWCSDQRCEERDGIGSLTKQFFGPGQKNGTTTCFYTNDHLGSIREQTDSSGVVQAALSYDSYGVATATVQSQTPDFEYAHYYLHQRSGLSLTRTRAYSSVIGRFISRDPIRERGGRNLYAYAGNCPVKFIDPTGTYLQGGIAQNVPNGWQQAQTDPGNYGNGSANYTGATQWNGSDASQSGQGRGWTGNANDAGNPPLPPAHGCATGGNNGDDDDDNGGTPPPEVNSTIPPSGIGVPPPGTSIFPPGVLKKAKAQCYKEFLEDKDDCWKKYPQGSWELYECIGNAKAKYFQCLSGK